MMPTIVQRQNSTREMKLKLLTTHYLTILLSGHRTISPTERTKGGLLVDN